MGLSPQVKRVSKWDSLSIKYKRTFHFRVPCKMLTRHVSLHGRNYDPLQQLLREEKSDHHAFPHCIFDSSPDD